MTKFIINLGGDSGGGGGGAELADRGMSSWAGYCHCQCFSRSPRPWSRPSSLPPPPSHPLTRRRGRCLAHQLPRLLLDSIASCESWFRWSVDAGRILRTPCFDKELVHRYLFPALRNVPMDKEICGWFQPSGRMTNKQTSLSSKKCTTWKGVLLNDLLQMHHLPAASVPLWPPFHVLVGHFCKIGNASDLTG